MSACSKLSNMAMTVAVQPLRLTYLPARWIALSPPSQLHWWPLETQCTQISPKFLLRLLLEDFCGVCHFFFLKIKIVVGDKIIYLILWKRQPLSQQTSATSPFHVLPAPFFLFSLPFPPLRLVNPWLLICFTSFSKWFFFLSFSSFFLFSTDTF